MNREDWKPSENFTLGEVETTDSNVVNAIPESLLDNAKRLADTVLEPWRALVGRLHVNSWYRCKELNARVGGSTNPPSAHLEARAADIVPLDKSIKDSFVALIKSDIQFDKAIFETNLKGHSWIHVQVRKDADKNRRMAMKSVQQRDGSYIYSEYKV